MADQFKTQDGALTGAILYQIRLPATTWFRREFVDLLRDMTLDYNWQQVGTVTVEEAIQAAESMFWSLTPMVGTLIAYITANPPTNALACDGAQYLRADYPELYAALDTVFIVDADNFVVPDLRGRTLIGAGSGAGLTPRSMGDTGGEETHQLSTAELASHTHTPSGHIHSIHSHIDLLAVAPGELPVSCPNPLPESTSNGYDTIANAGSDTAHENMPPFLALKYAVIAW